MKKLITIDLKQKIALLAGVVLLFLLCRPMNQLTTYENITRFSVSPDAVIESMEAFFLPGIMTDFLPTLFVSVLTGIIFFNYLFSKSRVDLYHSIPVNRTRLFITNYVSGVIIYVIALVLEYLIGILIAIPNHYMTGTAFRNILIGMAANFVHFLYGYSVTVFTVMLTGKLAVAVTGVLTLFFFFPVTATVLNFFKEYFYVTYVDFSYIIPDALTKYAWLSPFSSYGNCLSDMNSFTVYNRIIDYFVPGSVSQAAISVIAPFLMAAVVTALAYILYRKRPSEAAGKAVAFKIAQPVIRIPIVILGGLIGTWFMLSSVNGFKTKWLWFGLVLGVVLTHCVMEIIFRESFKALFMDKLQLLICVIAAVLIVGVYYGDLSGYDKYIPDKNKVEAAAVYIDGIDSGVSGLELVEDPKNPGTFISVYYANAKKPFENPGTSEAFINNVFDLAGIGVSNVDDMIKVRSEDTDNGIMYEAREAAVEESVYVADDDPMGELRTTGYDEISDEDAYAQAMAWMEENGIVRAEKNNTSRNISINIFYRLKGGKEIVRRYDVPVRDAREAMNEVYKSEEYNRTHFDLYEAVEKNAIHKVEIYDAFEKKVCLFTDKDAEEFLEVYTKDLKNIDLDTISRLPIGRISPLFKGEYLYEESYSGYYLYEEFANTMNYLKSLGCDTSGFTTEIKAEDIQTISINSYSQYRYEDGEYLYADELIYTAENDPEIIELLASKLLNANSIWSNEVLINETEEGMGADIFVTFKMENGMQKSASVIIKDNVIPEEVMKDIAVKIWKDQRY